MRSWEEELEGTLAKEEEIVRDLLKQAVMKTPALQVGNIAALNNIVNAEHPLVLQLQDVQAGQQRLLTERGIEGATLRDVIRQATERSEALSRRRETLLKAATELKRVNERNYTLAGARFKQYNELVKSMQKKPALYTSRGSAAGAGTPPKSFIDRTI